MKIPIAGIIAFVVMLIGIFLNKHFFTISEFFIGWISCCSFFWTIEYFDRNNKE